jgi:hypothetical protein
MMLRTKCIKKEIADEVQKMRWTDGIAVFL